MITSKNSVLVPVFTTLLGLAALALPNKASASSAAADFSTSSNPNGAWSYGWSTTLGSTFNLDTVNTNTYSGLPLGAWASNLAADGSPLVLHNGTANPVTLQNSTFQPGQLALGPGQGGQDSVLRWTAPSSGTYSISATFSGLSFLGDTADVHILDNGISFFDANVLPAATFSGSKVLLAGDTIDFVVGWGSNGNYNEDLTALSATIVPEPGALGLIAMGFGFLLSLGFRKRK